MMRKQGHSTGHSRVEVKEALDADWSISGVLTQYVSGLEL